MALSVTRLAASSATSFSNCSLLNWRRRGKGVEKGTEKERERNRKGAEKKEGRGEGNEKRKLVLLKFFFL